MNKYRGGTSTSIDAELDNLEIELGLRSNQSVEDEIAKLEEELK